MLTCRAQSNILGTAQYSFVVFPVWQPQYPLPFVVVRVEVVGIQEWIDSPRTIFSVSLLKCIHPEVFVERIGIFFVHSPETFLHAHHANVRARLTGAPFSELRVRAVVRALPIPNPRAYLGTAQAHVALDVVAVHGLRNLRQLTPVRA